MYIIFLNPQGNFDKDDSFIGLHPDFGGQLIYVKEVAKAMAAEGHRVDIVTRKIDERGWRPEFANEVTILEPNLRIVRISCGGDNFLTKEQLWGHLDEFVDNFLAFKKAEKNENESIRDIVDFATAHYADGGYIATKLYDRCQIPFIFTAHSLGAQKIDWLGECGAFQKSQSGFNSVSNDALIGRIERWETKVKDQIGPAMELKYKFCDRLAAERQAIIKATAIVISTNQERRKYLHDLYKDLYLKASRDKLCVISPGINESIFGAERQPVLDSLVEIKMPMWLKHPEKPHIIVLCRVDPKKNILGTVAAYAKSTQLQAQADLIIGVSSSIYNTFTNNAGVWPAIQDDVLGPVFEVIAEFNIERHVNLLPGLPQPELASMYRCLANQGSVFALTSFYEDFGLALVEAAACGLTCVATKEGGPAEMFGDGSGVLVDPFDHDDIARGLKEGLDRSQQLSWKGCRRVLHKYSSWKDTAAQYLQIMQHARNNG